jgi:hypothetical protein
MARFASTLMTALGVHVAVALALGRPATRPEALRAQPAGDTFVLLEQEIPAPVVQALRASAAPSAPEARPRAVAMRSQPATEPTRAPDAPHDAAEPASVPVPVPRPADSAGAGERDAPVDLGIGGYWKSVALGPPVTPSATREAPPAIAPSVDRILRDPLDAHDRALGLNAGGPLVTAAHEAASPALAPDVGAATLEIESDAAGKVTTARVVSAAADVAAWNDVAHEIVRLMSARVLHLPPGARGLRTRLRIRADRALPSGESVRNSAGAVPDDVPGSEPMCEGEGNARRCTKGLPFGATTNGSDIANVGAKRSRVVHVETLGEVVL